VDGNAVETTNGAGPHNIQMFVMAPDGTVLHCIPGYWNPEDLATELRLAERLGGVWQDKTISMDQKKLIFARMQMEHFRQHSHELTERSHMQGFDRKHELERKGFRDTIKAGVNINTIDPNTSEDIVKTTDEIMHERMAKRPFVSYSTFDTGKYSDYGTQFYDKHEDAMDEMGQRVANEEEEEGKKKHMSTMMDTLRHRPNHVAPAQAQHTPHCQVKVYGTLRSQTRVYGSLRKTSAKQEPDKSL